MQNYTINILFLNVNEKYKKMKLSSKLVYMLLKDRNRLSLKNNLYDENQKFLIFEIKNLVEISGMSKKYNLISTR